jgi:hypothetical protein
MSSERYFLLWMNWMQFQKSTANRVYSPTAIKTPELLSPEHRAAIQACGDDASAVNSYLMLFAAVLRSMRRVIKSQSRPNRKAHNHIFAVEPAARLHSRVTGKPMRTFI